MEKRQGFLFAFSILCIIIITIAYSVSIYPNYLLFVPKINFKNRYYELQLTSWITHFSINQTNIVAYYGFLSCEENFQGDWELEHFGWQKIIENNEDVLRVQTGSSLLTQQILKEWIFHKDKPEFQVIITKIYLFDSINVNNQIIIDLKDQTVLKMSVLSSNKPIRIQSPSKANPTETQLDFNNQSDNDYRFHRQAETETVSLDFSLMLLH